MRSRDAEYSHYRIADELFDHAAVRLDDRLHPLEVAGEQRAQHLRIRLLPELGRPGQVAEEHGNRLANLPASSACRERGATGVAEAGTNQVLQSATRAGGHE